MNQSAASVATKEMAPETDTAASFAARAIYFWDYYNLTQEVDYLTAAYQAMTDYHRHGGQGHSNVWSAIQETTANLVADA